MVIVAELVKVSATLVSSYTNLRSRDCIPFILFHSKDYFTAVSLDLLVSPLPDHTYFIFLPKSIMLLYYNESLWRLLSYIYIFTWSILPNCRAENWRRCIGNLQQSFWREVYTLIIRDGMFWSKNFYVDVGKYRKYWKTSKNKMYRNTSAAFLQS